MYICMYVCIYMHIYACTRMYAYISVNMYVCMHIYAYLCIYMCVQMCIYMGKNEICRFWLFYLQNMCTWGNFGRRFRFWGQIWPISRPEVNMSILTLGPKNKKMLIFRPIRLGLGPTASETLVSVSAIQKMP